MYDREERKANRAGVCVGGGGRGRDNKGEERADFDRSRGMETKGWKKQCLVNLTFFLPACCKPQQQQCSSQSPLSQAYTTSSTAQNLCSKEFCHQKCAITTFEVQLTVFNLFNSPLMMSVDGSNRASFQEKKHNQMLSKQKGSFNNL